jgi:hypothetical protein
MACVTQRGLHEHAGLCRISEPTDAIETQKALPLIYRGVKIDCAYRADLIVRVRWLSK